MREILEALLTRHPSLRVHFFDEKGNLRRFVLCFVNGEDTAWYDGLETRIQEGDAITVLQSVSGGPKPTTHVHTHSSPSLYQGGSP